MIDFTVISSKNVDLGDNRAAMGGTRVVGEDSCWLVLFIPLCQPSMKEAVDRAIESAGPDYDALIDGVVYSNFLFLVVTGKTSFKVEGTPVKSSEMRGDDSDQTALGPVLYHSDLEISNEAAIKEIGVQVLVEDHRAEKPQSER